MLCTFLLPCCVLTFLLSHPLPPLTFSHFFLGLFAVPLHFCHSSSSILSNSLCYCCYHRTISLFCLREKNLFSPPLSLHVISICCASVFLVCPHHTMFFLDFLPLPFSHGEETKKSISWSLSITQFLSLVHFLILPISSVSMQVRKGHRKNRYYIKSTFSKSKDYEFIVMPS